MNEVLDSLDRVFSFVSNNVTSIKISLENQSFFSYQMIHFSKCTYFVDSKLRSQDNAFRENSMRNLLTVVRISLLRLMVFQPTKLDRNSCCILYEFHKKHTRSSFSATSSSSLIFSSSPSSLFLFR